MPPKKTIPPPATPSQPPSQTKKKKPAVSWDKNGADGFSSIWVTLDWLAGEGNYQRWRGDTKAGSTKSALANQILSLMANCGITHRDNKGIQTKIQELQSERLPPQYGIRPSRRRYSQWHQDAWEYVSYPHSCVFDIINLDLCAHSVLSSKVFVKTFCW
jgi:hypothetical protein